MHEMHTDPKSEADLVFQSVTLRTIRHVTDLRGINRLAGRLSTSNCEFKLFRRPLLLAFSCRLMKF